MNSSPRRYARVLSIAGSDSGGGAGIQADLKTIAALGGYGMTAITAITVQNTVGVRAIQALPAELLAQQIDAVAAALQRHRFPHVVLDPVMVATSGDKLITQDTVAVLIRELFPLATLITPNLDEAGWLIGRNIRGVDELEGAARELLALGARAVLLKGGHLDGPELTDLLLAPPAAPQRWSARRIATRNTHGTGCTLSSAIACQLALGEPLAAAVQSARAYVRGALAAGADVATGHGHGPLNHGFAPQPTRVF